MLVKMLAISILSTSATLQFTPRKSLKTKVEFNMGLDQIQVWKVLLLLTLLIGIEKSY